MSAASPVADTTTTASRASSSSSSSPPAAPQGATKESTRICAHAPATLVPAKLSFTPQFERKHPELLGLFRRAMMAKPGSKWQQSTGTSADAAKGCSIIDKLRDCQAFLRQVRRLPHSSGLHATYLDNRATLRKTPLSRYGRPAAGTRKQAPMAGRKHVCEPSPGVVA